MSIYSFAAGFSHSMTIFYKSFPPSNAYMTKFDLALQRGKVKFIGLLVSKKKFLKLFLHVYGHGGHLGLWTIYIKFCFSFPWRLNMTFGFDWPFSALGDV